MKINRTIWILLLIATLGLAACNRSASKAPTAVPEGGVPDDAGQVANGDEPPESMATAVAGGGFLTQTADAETAGGDDQGVAVPEATETPEAPEPPTATPDLPPTATEPPAEVTEEPAAADCKSPYTVSKGEWVWSIGRKCNIHPDDIIKANNLQWPYSLYPGDTLTLPENARPFPSGG